MGLLKSKIDLDKELENCKSIDDLYPNKFKNFLLGWPKSRASWTMPIQKWKGALSQFAILYEERMQIEMKL